MNSIRILYRLTCIKSNVERIECEILTKRQANSPNEMRHHQNKRNLIMWAAYAVPFLNLLMHTKLRQTRQCQREIKWAQGVFQFFIKLNKEKKHAKTKANGKKCIRTPTTNKSKDAHSLDGIKQWFLRERAKKSDAFTKNKTKQLTFIILTRCVQGLIWSYTYCSSRSFCRCRNIW